MKLLKTIMMTTAVMAVPTAAFAQFSIGSITDVAKDKGTQTILDNATGGDALNAGTTLLKGGSREDAAVAVVKGRADKRLDNLTGGVSGNDLSRDGLISTGASIGSNQLGNSAATTIAPKNSTGTLLDQASGVVGTSGSSALPNLGKIGL